jgi:hypothetical protein
MQAIGAWPALKYLNLSGSEITDRGMAYLAKLTSLERLQVVGTRVSDRRLA